jgi:pilus assembly protein CpaE
MRRGRHGQCGQASVETVALLPVALVVALAVWQAVLAGWALVSAEAAARAGARAVLAGSPAGPAAAAALPGGMRRGLEVRRTGGAVMVRVRIPAVLPGLDAAVSASAAAVRG